LCSWIFEYIHMYVETNMYKFMYMYTCIYTFIYVYTYLYIIFNIIHFSCINLLYFSGQTWSGKFFLIKHERQV
jgi:hypothetical protein